MEARQSKRARNIKDSYDSRNNQRREVPIYLTTHEHDEVAMTANLAEVTYSTYLPRM